MLSSIPPLEDFKVSDQWSTMDELVSVRPATVLIKVKGLFRFGSHFIFWVNIHFLVGSGIILSQSFTLLDIYIIRCYILFIKIKFGHRRACSDLRVSPSLLRHLVTWHGCMIKGKFDTHWCWLAANNCITNSRWRWEQLKEAKCGI